MKVNNTKKKYLAEAQRRRGVELLIRGFLFIGLLLYLQKFYNNIIYSTRYIGQKLCASARGLSL
jgi:hypothetical protein